jgi:hypothetical protein
VSSQAAPRASRGSWLARLAELLCWKDELEASAATRLAEADEFRARWRAAGGTQCTEGALARELGERCRDNSWFEEFEDWGAARLRLVLDARAAGATVAQALELTHRECAARGLKPTQTFARWLTRGVGDVSRHHEGQLAKAESDRAEAEAKVIRLATRLVIAAEGCPDCERPWHECECVWVRP